MWVLRRVPKEESGADRRSPWGMSLHIDTNNRAWYATGLAKPTLFESEEDARRKLKIVQGAAQHFPAQEIFVATYHEVFGRHHQDDSQSTQNG